MKHIIRMINKISLLAICCLFCTAIFATDDATFARQYHLKGALLKYIIEFIEWPKDTLPQYFVNICLLGDFEHPKGINAVNGLKAQERVIVVRTIDSIDGAKNNCQMLYLAHSEESNIPTILNSFKGKPVLLLGDMRDFAKNGGNINFDVINNNVALTLNLETLAQANLKINPEVMELVTIIPEVEDVFDE